MRDVETGRSAPPDGAPPDGPDGTRRAFVSTVAALAARVTIPSASRRHPSKLRADVDIVIRNGTVLDGSGSEGRLADVSIRGDRIHAVGPALPHRGRTEIDARGLAVAPGFIDIHSHGVGTLAADNRLESVVRQGVTTMVVGADGSSPSAGAPEAAFGATLARLQALRPSVNVASMVGLGSVRAAVIGNDNRPATPAELRRMRAMVERALAEGACGASSGLEYTPGAFATVDELVALCTPLAARGLVYATHMRNEDDQLLDAIREALAVARGARCGLQVSHLKTQGPRNWPRLDDAFALIDGARRDGIDVAFDRYPYLAYATGLSNLLPVWCQDGSTDAFLARLTNPALAPRIEAESRAKVELIGGWDNVLVTSVRAAVDRDAEGKRLGAWAQATGRDPYAALVGLLQRSRGDVGMAGFAMSEPNLERILAHPVGMVCSDGGAFAIDGPTRRGSPHPRGAGTFPRVLGRYVRERHVLTLEDAIRKMTAMPAERLRLKDRGRLAPGMFADVVAFDPATVRDTATFEQPFQYPVGIPLVIVNGAITLRDGQRARTFPGRVLRSVTG